jgi:hypothetical protein
MSWTNHDAAHRHVHHAYEDFRRLRKERHNEELWHSLSHHLRHAVFRTGLEVKEPRARARRRFHQ